MKGLSIKKLAAVAAGAALVGTALAPIVSAIDVSKSDIYGSSGAPNVSIVVGASAQISDGVWAGNIATAIAEHATKTTSIAASGEAGEGGAGTPSVSDLSVDLTVGGTVTYGAGSKQYKVYLDGGGTREVDTNQLNDSQLPHLYNNSITYKVDGTSSTATFQEKIGVSIQAKFDAASSIQDLTAKVDSTEFYYLIDLNSSGGIDLGTTAFTDTGSDDSIKLPFFGSLYQLNQATLTGTKNIKLVKTAAVQQFNEGESVTGLQGRAAYDGEELTAKIVRVAQSGPAVDSYKVTVALYDADGEYINQQTVDTGANMADEFVDSNDDYVLLTNLFIDSINVASTSGVGYVEVTKGTDTVLLYDTYGYPYDATDTLGPFDYKVTITVDSNSLQQIKIYNSREAWTDSSSDNGPIYPTNSGDSLSGATGEEVLFGQALEEGTAGRGYAKIEFAGFESTQDKTAIKIGKDSSILDELDSSKFGGGLYFRDTDDQVHNIPMALKLTKYTAEGGTTFTFDTKTIWYQVFADTSDLNVLLTEGDYVNGTLISDINCTDDYDVNLLVGAAATGTQFTYYGSDGVGAEATGMRSDFNAAGVVLDLNSGACGSATSISFRMQSGGYFVMRADTNSGALKLNTSGDSTDFTYGKIFYNDDNTFVGDAAGSAIEIESTSDEKFSYAARVTTETEADSKKLWLVLRADADIGSGSSIQNSHSVEFKGSMIPADTTESDIGPDGPSVDYFLPKSRDWNKNNTFENSNAYFYSWFVVAPRGSTTIDANVYIDNSNGGLVGSFPNSQLTYPAQDVYFNNNGSNTWNLKTGTDSAYLSAAWTKDGDKVEVDTDNDTAIFSLPEAAEKITLYVHGTEISRTTTGESLTINEGATDSTAEGTTISIDAVNYSAECAGGEVTGGDCACTPSSVEASVAVDDLVALDTQAGAGSHIIVGGHIVNQLAASVSGLADRLTAPGDSVADVIGGEIVVAGYTGADTGRAAQELIDCIESDFSNC